MVGKAARDNRKAGAHPKLWRALKTCA